MQTALELALARGKIPNPAATPLDFVELLENWILIWILTTTNSSLEIRLCGDHGTFCCTSRNTHFFGSGLLRVYLDHIRSGPKAVIPCRAAPEDQMNVSFGLEVVI
jgi:hypothetical protein